jgi:antitoxin VapB
MALNIKNSEADRLARELAETTGESLTEAVVNALRERLVRKTGRRDPKAMLVEIQGIQSRFRRRPLLDPRTPEEILGYDDSGLPA